MVTSRQRRLFRLIRPLLVGCVVLLCVGFGHPHLTSAGEIGDYLSRRDWRLPPGGLRVDTLAEDTTYSSRFRGEPPMGWFDRNRTFLHWLPPLVVPEFGHADPDDPRRHIGLGQPLEGTSWRNRPYHVGWLFGGMYGDDLVDQTLAQTNDVFGGYRIGWDHDHYWGVEGRVAWSKLQTTHIASGTELPASRNVFFDASLSYYPWGDARWRPYGSLGVGVAEFSFHDRNRILRRDHSLTLPVAIGVKYYWRKFMSLRAEAIDNIAFSSDRVDTMHNFSLTLGVEYRFGPPHRVYSW